MLLSYTNLNICSFQEKAKYLVSWTSGKVSYIGHIYIIQVSAFKSNMISL